MSTQPSEKDKTRTIIVNGRPKEVEGKELTFEEIVNLAFDNNPPTGENIVITVTYSKGEEGKKEGTLLPGESVKIKDGMVFNVTATDKS
jgi:multiubiquitin